MADKLAAALHGSTPADEARRAIAAANRLVENAIVLSKLADAAWRMLVLAEAYEESSYNQEFSTGYRDGCRVAARDIRAGLADALASIPEAITDATK